MSLVSNPLRGKERSRQVGRRSRRSPPPLRRSTGSRCLLPHGREVDTYAYPIETVITDPTTTYWPLGYPPYIGYPLQPYGGYMVPGFELPNIPARGYPDLNGDPEDGGGPPDWNHPPRGPPPRDDGPPDEGGPPGGGGPLETLEVWEDIPIEEKEVPRDLEVSQDLKDIQAPEVMMADKAHWDHLDPKD